MKEKPLISIVVPCYNIKEYINQCLNSILSQTYKNLELILVDDGSTDGTSDICDIYSNKDARVKVIHKTNGGLVSARNLGFKFVTGEWMMYVDGDDWIELTLLSRLIDIINKYENLDVIFWPDIQDMGNGKTVEGKFSWSGFKTNYIYNSDESKWLALQSMNYKAGIAAAYDKLLRTEWCIKNNIIHNPKLRQGGEGLDFSLRVFYNSSASYFLNETLLHYRFNPNSISKKVNEKNAYYLLDCFNEMENFVLSISENSTFKEMLYERIVYGIIAMAMQTYFNPANNDSYKDRRNKFIDYINKSDLLVRAISSVKYQELDPLRKIAFFSIKHHWYFLLDFIGTSKQVALKYGFFKY